MNHIRYTEGYTLGETVIRVTARIVHPEFAKEINWVGANTKVAFRDFLFIFETIRRKLHL